MANVFNLNETFVHLKASGADVVEAGPDFWSDLASGERAFPGRLAMVLPMREDFSHWERHPLGEELIFMLSGSCTVILENDGGETELRLNTGQAMLVPKNVWHRAIIHEPGEALFVTEGEGTDHKPID